MAKAPENSNSPSPQSADAAGQDNAQKMQLRIPPDLEYVYRDLFNVFGGPSEVILEFGNQHRSVPNNASISNRIVLSYQTTSRLQQALTQTLAAAQKRAQEQMQQAAGNSAAGDSTQ